MESLAGVRGRPGLGLILQTDNINTDIAISLNNTLVAENPGRVWALISNQGVLPVYVGFGVTGGLNGTFHLISPGGNLLINKEFPWTGRVGGLSAAPNICRITEASIQQ